MQLSKKALEDLRTYLVREIGFEHTSELNDEEINQLGDFLLTLFAMGLKRKMKKGKDDTN